MAAPYLTHLRDQTQQTALLSVPGNGEPIVLSCVERLALIRERFYEDALDEVRLGINALSAPVFRDNDELAGIIGIVGTSAQTGTPTPRPLVLKLQQIAAALSADLNCRIYSDRGLAR